MRFVARALVCTLLVVCGRDVLAAESGSGWWPFGHREEANVSQPVDVSASSSPFANSPLGSDPAGTQSMPPGPVAHEVQMPQNPPVDSSKAKSSWLGLHAPKLSKPHLPKTGAADHTPKPSTSRNAWADTTPAAPKPSPLQSVKNGAHSVAEGTKSAYHKTVSALTPGSKSKPAAAGSSHLAQRDVQPPFWKRMLGAKKPELQQPQTVPQWMAQKRLDP